MKLLIRLLLILATWGALPSQAETFITFDKCADSKGRAVKVLADASIKEVVSSGIEGDEVFIRYNAKAVPQLLPESRQFLFAHECARHFLGFPILEERTLERARRADCEALSVLMRSKLLGSAADVAPIVEDLKMVTAQDWALLPGPQRELKLGECKMVAETRGGLAVPGAPARSEKWSACVHACGARLYSCGRSALCQMAYDQCNQKCGDY